MKPSTERVQRSPASPGQDGQVTPGVPPGAGGTGEVARPALGLWDAVSIIVGIVVGAGIYQTAPLIFKNTDGPGTALLAWGAAGVLSLVGALCYAELATAYPRDGGDIIYLGRAYGNWLGFQFGWVQLTVLLTGSIGMMAFIFANYARRFVEAALGAQLGPIAGFAFAGAAVLLLTAANVVGVVFGKTVQNVLSVAKVLGLGAIVVAGFHVPYPGAWQEPGLSLGELRKLTFPDFAPSLGLAMILILYTYGGWNDAAFVAAEVRDGKRNLTRALVLGILVVTALYLLVNAAYVTGLGFAGAQKSNQVAADVLQRGFGRGGETLMCVLVMVSALGAINGLIFTGARVYSTIGRQYSTLSWMGGWSGKQGAPVPALVTQGVLTLGLIFLVGTEAGKNAINSALAGAHLQPVKDWEGAGGFDTLLAFTTPVFWAFFLLTGLAVFILRENDRATPRLFKVPLYPELPLLFCATCGYMLYSSIAYAVQRKWGGGLVLVGVLPLAVGILVYRLSRRLDAPGPAHAVPARELAERPV